MIQISFSGLTFHKTRDRRGRGNTNMKGDDMYNKGSKVIKLKGARRGICSSDRGGVQP